MTSAFCYGSWHRLAFNDSCALIDLEVERVGFAPSSSFGNWVWVKGSCWMFARTVWWFLSAGTKRCWVNSAALNPLQPVEEVLGGRAPSCVGSAALTCKQLFTAREILVWAGELKLKLHFKVKNSNLLKSKLELGFAFWSEGPKRLHKWLMK